jgi:phage repressor protein C with HTH and peptisase S24 domain
MDSTFSASSDDFAEHLRFWRISQNLTQAEAGKLLDIDRSYYSQIEGGKRKPGNALRTRFQLVEKSSSIKPSGNVRGAAYGLRNIPILSWAQAGQATDFEQMSEWDEVVPSDVADERSFGVRLRGDSMEPKFSDGDIAILLPSTAPTNGEIVVANIRNQGALCKIMHVQLDKKLVKLSSYNPAYPPTEYHRDEFHWIFPVAAIIKQLRRR